MENALTYLLYALTAYIGLAVAVGVLAFVIFITVLVIVLIANW